MHGRRFEGAFAWIPEISQARFPAQRKSRTRAPDSFVFIYFPHLREDFLNQS